MAKFRHTQFILTLNLFCRQNNFPLRQVSAQNIIHTMCPLSLKPCILCLYQYATICGLQTYSPVYLVSIETAGPKFRSADITLSCSKLSIASKLFLSVDTLIVLSLLNKLTQNEYNYVFNTVLKCACLKQKLEPDLK